MLLSGEHLFYLSKHHDPFVLVGKYALNWMGVPVHSGYVSIACLTFQLPALATILAQIMDILPRVSQVGSIYKTLSQSGEWLGVTKSSMP